jgi:hypothetical protein
MRWKSRGPFYSVTATVLRSHSFMQEQAGRAVAGIVATAPHVFVEDLSIAGIAAVREAYLTSDLRERLLGTIWTLMVHSGV